MVELNEQEYAIVCGSALFCGIDGETVRHALASDGASVMRYKRGSVLARPGETQRRLGILLHGSAEVYKAAHGSSVLMSVLSPGGMFGMAVMFQPDGAAVTRLVARAGAEVLFLDEATVKEAMRMDFAVVENYLSHLASRVHFLTDRLESIASPNVAQRLMSYLRSTAADGRVTLPRGYTKLADSLCVSRASLYRVMGELCEAGEIKREGNEIIILHGTEEEIEL